MKVNIWKYVSIMVIAICLLLIVMNLMNYERISLIRRAEALAVALSQLNGMLASESVFVEQVNDVLVKNGYPELVREVEIKEEQDE